jgi:hypothetical protein
MVWEMDAVLMHYDNVFSLLCILWREFLTKQIPVIPQPLHLLDVVPRDFNVLQTINLPVWGGGKKKIQKMPQSPKEWYRVTEHTQQKYMKGFSKWQYH